MTNFLTNEYRSQWDADTWMMLVAELLKQGDNVILLPAKPPEWAMEAGRKKVCR